MNIKKNLIFISILSLLFISCFCIYNTLIVSAVGEQTAQVNDVFRTYQKTEIEENVFKFEPRNFSGTDTPFYYDFLPPSVSYQGDINQPYKNYIYYNAEDPDGTGTKDFTLYGQDQNNNGYLNYVGVNFEMKEFPYSTYPNIEEINTPSGTIGWSNRAWNNLKVSTNNNEVAKSFKVVSLGDMANYKRNTLYMLVATSVFSSQAINTDYVYWGSTVLAYLMPVEAPITLGSFTDRVTQSNLDIEGDYYYHTNSDVIYELVIQPLITSLTSGIDGYTISYNFNNNLDYRSKSLNIIKIEYRDDIYGEWIETAGSTLTPTQSTHYLDNNGINNRAYRISYKYNFDVSDSNPIVPTKNFTTFLTVQPDTELSPGAFPKLDDETNEEYQMRLVNILNRDFEVQIKTLDERGNL